MMYDVLMYGTGVMFSSPKILHYLSLVNDE